MFKKEELKYVERAFQIERESYNETIEYLRYRVCELEADLKTATNTTIKDLSSETIKQLEIEKENLQVQNEQLKGENERLQKELDQCGKKTQRHPVQGVQAPETGRVHPPLAQKETSSS